MTKEEFINKIVCEHWFCLGNWTKGRKWDDKKKQIWLSGMHRAWNTFFPSDKIGPFEIVRKVATWTKEEAEEWYIDYISDKEKDDAAIHSRKEFNMSKDMSHVRKGEISVEDKYHEVVFRGTKKITIIDQPLSYHPSSSNYAKVYFRKLDRDKRFTIRDDISKLKGRILICFNDDKIISGEKTGKTILHMIFDEVVITLVNIRDHRDEIESRYDIAGYDEH